MRFRVLLAEGHKPNRELATQLLQKLGCRVDLAVDGREAVTLAIRSPYDAIFMACHMPELDGFQATAEIRRWEAECATTRSRKSPRLQARIPIVAVSDSVLETERGLCESVGMDDLITKPFHQDELRRAVEKWCGGGILTPL